jgi:MoaA/NifB/PqqE/SkfB family radical SAM enzyme
MQKIFKYFKSVTTLTLEVNSDLKPHKNSSHSRRHKQLKLRRELQLRQTADFYYLIDIVGSCNLKCPSCPVGNYEEQPTKGIMSLETYNSILHKISIEHPGEKIFIDLYNWGEPGIHKNLGEIIKLTHEFGYGVGISSNLNVFADMKAAIKAQPDYIRISLSGYYNEIYQQTHMGGDINLVKSNMHMLRHLIDKTQSKTIVQVGFHIYKSNFPEDFFKIRELCEDLDFIFAPTLAALMPVEKAVLVVEGKELPGHDSLLDNLVVTTSERVKLLSQARSQYTDCQYRSKRTTINFDGSVPLCCATFEQEQIIASNFLEISRNDLTKRKYAHKFCNKCQYHSLDMVYTGVEPHLVEAKAVTLLGKVYGEFLEEWNISLDPVVEWRSKELSVQEAYDKAINHINSADKESAKELFLALLLVAPHHGEANLQLGGLLEAEGLYPEALTRYEEASAIWPDHKPYTEALARVKVLV